MTLTCDWCVVVVSEGLCSNSQIADRAMYVRKNRYIYFLFHDKASHFCCATTTTLLCDNSQFAQDSLYYYVS